MTSYKGRDQRHWKSWYYVDGFCNVECEPRKCHKEQSEERSSQSRFLTKMPEDNATKVQNFVRRNAVSHLIIIIHEFIFLSREFSFMFSVSSTTYRTLFFRCKYRVLWTNTSMWDGI
jgi:hypothetical protein